uniref:PX domain-containing protein n=1 Tax=Kalanchoe fedtschenkoi TaxID=63787 RepID=A0A7N0T5S7_KALFE
MEAAKREESIKFSTLLEMGDGEALSPISSRYSSCGESEFDRYCSANSAMATPSLCSTSFRAFSDCNDSDFGSLRSLGFGGDDLSLDCLSLSSRIERGNGLKVEVGACDGLDRLNDVRSLRGFGEDGVADRGGGGGLGLPMDMSSISADGLYGDDDTGGLIAAYTGHEMCGSQLTCDAGTSHSRDGGVEDDCRDRGGLGSGGSYVAESEAVVNTFAEGVLECDGKNKEGLFEEDGASSRGDYSGGEDSGFEGSASEREVKTESRNWRGQQKGEEGVSRNPLVMGSSEAYGMEDWDDFADSNGEDIFANMEKHVYHHGNRNITEFRDNPLETSYEGEIASAGPGVHETAADAPRPGGNENSPDTHSELADVVRNTFESEHDGLVKDFPYSVGGEVIEIPKSYVLESQPCSKVNLDPLSDAKVNHLHTPSVEALIEDTSNRVKDSEHELSVSKFMDHRLSDHPFVSASAHEADIKPVKMDPPESNESLDDFVTEMEEILLDSVDSPGLRFNQVSNIFHPQLSLPSRASLSAASTSDQGAADPAVHHVPRIDGVEVVGAKQKKGDVSLGERLVGVKEYTVYRIRVWSGNDRWEVERRYRDFCTLYRRLKAQYADRGLALPSPWLSVERESRKMFGNASPDVVAERSILIQECLTSVVNSRVSSSSPGALLWFLSPQDSFISTPRAASSRRDNDGNTEITGSLGKTISLIVEVKRVKSLKQQLEAQHGRCAGCHQYFDEGKTMMLEIIHTLGWGKPRLCEYTGQLFCHSCHTNETSVLPARVLHQWDFTPYPVSQMAKSYLESIHDKPMLCVSAVNPLLLSKVPALLQVMNIRKKIGAMLPYLRCPFRRTINKGLGSRRYLLESNDFFSLRDLIDLSRGPFSALPVMVETVSRKILEHITEQCLFCCDAGVVCGAKQACRDPTALIFPFQESEVKKCRSCGLVFHEPCFKKLTNCSCEAHLRLEKAPGSAHRLDGGSNSEAGVFDAVRKNLASSLSETISGLFSKTTKSDRLGRQNSDSNVILMGSMPSDAI